jgi:hypothetical protein
MSFAGPAGVSIRYAGTIIHPRQCQDFVTVGRCADARCLMPKAARQHGAIGPGESGGLHKSSDANSGLCRFQDPEGAVPDPKETLGGPNLTGPGA